MDISSFFSDKKPAEAAEEPADAAEEPAEAAAAERPYSKMAHEVRERYRVDLDEANRQLKAAKAELAADSSLGKEYFKSNYDKLTTRNRGKDRWQLKLGLSFTATAKSAVNAPISGLNAQQNCKSYQVGMSEIHSEKNVFGENARPSNHVFEMEKVTCSCQMNLLGKGAFTNQQNLVVNGKKMVCNPYLCAAACTLVQTPPDEETLRSDNPLHIKGLPMDDPLQTVFGPETFTYHAKQITTNNTLIPVAFRVDRTCPAFLTCNSKFVVQGGAVVSCPSGCSWCSGALANLRGVLGDSLGIKLNKNIKQQARAAASRESGSVPFTALGKVANRVSLKQQIDNIADVSKGLKEICTPHDAIAVSFGSLEGPNKDKVAGNELYTLLSSKSKRAFVVPLIGGGYRNINATERNRHSDVLCTTTSLKALPRIVSLIRASGCLGVVHVQVIGKPVDPNQAKDVEEHLQVVEVPIIVRETGTVSLHDPDGYVRGNLSIVKGGSGKGKNKEDGVLLGNAWVTLFVGFVSALCLGKLILPPDCPKYKQSVLMEYAGASKAEADDSAQMKMKSEADDSASIESEADDSASIESGANDSVSIESDADDSASIESESTNFSFGSSTSIHGGESAPPPSIAVAKKQKLSPAEEAAQEALATLWTGYSMRCNGVITVDYSKEKEPKKRMQE